MKVINKAGRIGMLVMDKGHWLKKTSGSQIVMVSNSMEGEARVLITETLIQVCVFAS